MSIEIKNLSFSYGKHRVLEDISLTVNDGELLAVLGPNGVGKTTLFNCMLRLLNGYSGQTLIDGVSVNDMKVTELARKVAYVPQSHYPSFSYSVFDMVLMGTTPHIHGVASPGRREMEQSEQALEKLGILHLRDRAYTQISGGERQLTLIARALAQQAKVIIMDEPTANLDYGNQLRVLSGIKELAAGGYTIIQSTHSPDHAFLFADSVLALMDGRVAAYGAPKDVITPELVKALYNVEVQIQVGNASYTCVPIISA